MERIVLLGFLLVYFITAVPLGMTISIPISGMMADHRGPSLPSIIGLSMATAGALLLSFNNITETYILTCVGLLLVGTGIGIGMFTPPYNSHVMGNVPKHALGVAGGMLNMSRTLGMSLGITLGGLSYQFFMGVYGKLSLTHLVYTFRSAYFLVAVFSFLTLIMTSRSYKNEFKNMDGYSTSEE